MTTTSLPRWIEGLLQRLHEAASQFPDLGHVALRSTRDDWPWHTLGSRKEPGLDDLSVAAVVGTPQRMPIALMPHWLFLDGQLYQGYFLHRHWDWSETDQAEAAVERMMLLNEEAAALFGARIKELPAATLPEEITELDGSMSVVYQELPLAPRWDRDLEIRLIAGNVFTTVGRVTEQLAEASIRQPAAANKVSEPEPKPDLPTRSFCLLLPNCVRWEGEVEVQQRLWVLLGLL